MNKLSPLQCASTRRDEAHKLIFIYIIILLFWLFSLGRSIVLNFSHELLTHDISFNRYLTSKPVLLKKTISLTDIAFTTQTFDFLRLICPIIEAC